MEVNERHVELEVYYRDTTTLMAERLGLTGAAWNLSDGRVEILAEGSQARLGGVLSGDPLATHFMFRIDSKSIETHLKRA